jgi:DNA-binding transcriptional regulator YiaG
LKYFYDRKSDSLYLSLAERRAYRDSMEAVPGVVLDFDDHGQLIGIDLERASRVIDVSDLELHEEPSAVDAETARLDGVTLRQKREQLNLSQLELARKLSVSPNTVARWERGELKIEHPGMLQLALGSLQNAAAQDAPTGASRTYSDKSARPLMERARPVRKASADTVHSVGGKNIHTIPRDGGWVNVRPDGDRASSVHRTQAEAIERGREIAQNAGVKHVVHGTNGRIRDSNSYGNDPHPPKERESERKSDRIADSRRAKKK